MLGYTVILPNKLPFCGTGNGPQSIARAITKNNNYGKHETVLLTSTQTEQFVLTLLSQSIEISILSISSIVHPSVF